MSFQINKSGWMLWFELMQMVGWSLNSIYSKVQECMTSTEYIVHSQCKAKNNKALKARKLEFERNYVLRE
jgi:hypothetical protein